MKNKTAYSVPVFLIRVLLIHTLTYFVTGAVISNIFNYQAILNSPIIRDYMIGYGSASIFWGPFVQPIRGLVIGMVLMPFRTFLGGSRFGWLYLWLIIVGIGILSTPAAAPSSIEGLIYTRLPIWYHLIGLPEMLIQTLAFSLLVHLYMRHPSGIISSLPPMFGVMLQAFSGACFAFIGYAVVSILYATIGNAQINTSANLSLKVQGLFFTPLIFNFLIIFYYHINQYFCKTKRIVLFGIVWGSNAIVIGVYQEILLGNANLGYAILAPILPALIISGIFLKNSDLAVKKSESISSN